MQFRRVFWEGACWALLGPTQEPPELAYALSGLPDPLNGFGRGAQSEVGQRENMGGSFFSREKFYTPRPHFGQKASFREGEGGGAV